MNYFQRLRIDPKDYMSLIYEMTLEKVRNIEDDKKVRAFSNSNNIRTEQILTEQGICYVANNFLALNLSTKYEQLGNVVFICQNVIILMLIISGT